MPVAYKEFIVMSLFLTLAFLFFFGSVLGWVIELFFRRISEGKWINPGFLRGPYLPIYGFGLLLMYLMCRIDLSAIPWLWAEIVLRILLIGLCMTLIEYIAGIIFIKWMKVKLWDYSQEKFNIQGIICLRFSLIWTAIGAVYYLLLDNLFCLMVSWLIDHITLCFFLGIFYGILIVDLVYSTQLISRIRAFAEKYDIIVRYENLKDRDSLKEMKVKPRFFDSFKTPAPLESFLRKFSQREREEAARQSRSDRRKKENATETGIAAEHTDLLPPPSSATDNASPDRQASEESSSAHDEN